MVRFSKSLSVGIAYSQSITVRSQLLGSQAPQINSLGASMIFGEVTLGKAQYEIQLNIARSFYLLHGKDFQILIALSSVAEDQLTAQYYWILTWADPEASNQNYWALTASPEERLAFALKKLENVPDCFATVVKITMAERVSSPFKVMDFVPKGLPRGRVSLIGDAAHTMTPCKFLTGYATRHPLICPTSSWRGCQPGNTGWPQPGEGY